jgi:ribonuclease HI
MSIGDSASVKNELYRALDCAAATHAGGIVVEEADADLLSILSLWRRLKAVAAAQSQATVSVAHPVKRQRSESATELQRATAPQSAPAVTQLHVYTDGSCLGNGTSHASAGWGVTCSNGTEAYGKLPGRATNLRAEVAAGIVALVLIGPNAATIYTDSDYLFLAVTEESRLASWAKNGWKTKAKTTVANIDLFQIVHKLLARREKLGWPTIAFVHVPAHSGIEGNERADKLAALGCKEKTYTLTNASDNQKENLRTVLTEAFYAIA